jgi:hypothetical protein
MVVTLRRGLRADDRPAKGFRRCAGQPFELGRALIWLPTIMGVLVDSGIYKVLETRVLQTLLDWATDI